MYSLTVFVPESHLDIVKNALFQAGAGHFGSYDHCCWQTKGQGQFRPLAGSQPFVGVTNQLEQITEWRIEMVVSNDKLHAVIEALKTAHPYEVPAYQVIAMIDVYSQLNSL